MGDLSLSGRALADSGPEALKAVEPHLQSQDLMFANYEGVLLDLPAPSPFTAPQDRATLLRVAHRAVVNVANNHTSDHGYKGLSSTVAALEAAGFDVIGLDPPDRSSASHIARCHGLVIAFLAATRTGAPVPSGFPRVHELDWDVLRHSVERAKEAVLAIPDPVMGHGTDELAPRPAVDIVVVSVHAGYMYVDHPHPEHRRQVLALLEAGADLVLMHHPHVLQGVEVGPNGGVACYSLGNFLVDPREGCLEVDIEHDLQRQGAIFSFQLDRDGVSAVDILPTVIKNGSRVEPADAKEAAEIVSRLRRISAELQGDYQATFYQQRAERNTGLGIAGLRSLLLTGRWGLLLRMLSRARLEHAAMLWSHCTRHFRR
ncbi:MAG: CapA family protein [Thermoanaerobaculia bacterium]|nr:CapA family protein [Thermoanaerobaculia bacterium]